jgi:predicted transcriptional regulator
MKKAAYLTPGEFELMEVLWSRGEASVRQVWERVTPQRAVAYTTVMTILFKMYRKGVLSQRKEGKAYIYAPTMDREQALKGVVDQVRDVYFKGSTRELMRFIDDNRNERAVHQIAAPGLAPETTSAQMDEFLL